MRRRVLLLGMVAPFVVGSVSAQEAEPLTGLRGVERMEAWFASRPHLTTTPGSGWKPFSRLRYLRATRLAPEGVSAAEARVLAWREKTVREASPDRPGRSAAWFSAGPVSYAGRCTSIAFDPTDAAVVYVGAASGGLWKTTDGGDTWAPLTDSLPSIAIGAVKVLPSDPSIVLIGTGEGVGSTVWGGNGPFGVGIFKSTDAGVTWASTGLSYALGSTHGFNVIEANPVTGTLLAGANDGLWRSTDDGDTWTRVLTAGNVYDVKWQPGSVSRVYAARGRDPFFNFGSNNGVFVSDDDGLVFALSGSGQPPPALIAKTKIAVTPADPNVIYASYVRSDTYQSLGVYRSTDAGATWSVRDSTTNMVNQQGWYDLSLAADPDDSQRIVTGGVNLRVSTDGGLTYRRIDPASTQGTPTIPHVDHHAAVWEPGSTSNLWIATDGGPWRSTDDGDTWLSRREGIVSYQFFDICVSQLDPLFMAGGTQDNGVPLRQGVTSWTGPSGPFGDAGVCNAHPALANVVYAESQFGAHRKSMNSGQSWITINNGLTGTALYIAPTDEDPNLGRRLFTSTSDGIFRTTDGGTLWENVAPHTARWISISPVDGNVVWTVAFYTGVTSTTDGGATWAASASFPVSGQETKIHAHPTDAARAIVTVGGYGTGLPHVLQTTDGGATWLDATGDLPDIPVNTLIVDPDFPGDWYAGTDLGVWASSDEGATWTPFGAGLPNVLVMDLEIRRPQRKLVAGTHGRGVWEIQLAGPVDAPVVSAPSLRLMLDAPWPNPTSGEATLRFAANTGRSTDLSIYDVSGRRVARVGAGEPGDGIIRVARWDAGRAAPGVYFAVLRSGAERLSRKVVVRR